MHGWVCKREGVGEDGREAHRWTHGSLERGKRRRNKEGEGWLVGCRHDGISRDSIAGDDGHGVKAGDGSGVGWRMEERDGREVLSRWGCMGRRGICLAAADGVISSTSG